MTYDRQHLSVDWLFKIGGSDEIAATGINYSVAAGWANAAAALDLITAATTELEVIVDAMATFLLPTNGLNWANYSELVGVKIAAIGTDGKYLPTASNPVEHAADAGTFGTESAVLPQSSVVVSLRSGQAFGVANYGRMYIPHTRSSMVAGSPYIDPTNLTNISEAAVVLINAVTGALNDATPYELLPTIMTNKTGEAAKTIAQVAVGNVIDTQRRRRNRLNETYDFALL